VTIGVVTIRFTSKRHLGSRLMALLAQSEWANHCMLIEGGMAYEAVCWHGVRYVTLDAAMRGVKMYQDMVVAVPNIEATRAWMRSVLGAGYDWPGAAGIPFQRSDNWQDPLRWWCSEFLLKGLSEGDLNIIDFNEVTRGTPNDLHQYPAPKSPVVEL
jgi:hypothetical protein